MVNARLPADRYVRYTTYTQTRNERFIRYRTNAEIARSTVDSAICSSRLDYRRRYCIVNVRISRFPKVTGFSDANQENGVSRAAAGGQWESDGFLHTLGRTMSILFGVAMAAVHHST